MRGDVAAKLGAIALFWLAIGLVQVFNWGHGEAKAAILLLLLLATPLVVIVAQHGPSPLSPRLRRLASLGGVALLALQLLYLSLRIADPHLIDIATTTLAAGRTLLHGLNPYAAHIDGGPETHGVTGYKYLPVMIAIYLPLGQLFGQRGILLTNLLLFLACLVLVKRLGRSALAPFLLLMLPLVPEQIFAKGATDLAAVLPLLGAFAATRRRPFVSGFCLGLSIAAKPVPGVTFLPALTPPRERLTYLTGLALGLAPILPFLWWAPHAFLANIFFFNLNRSADATSWLFDLPRAVATSAHVVTILLILGAGLYVAKRNPSLATRCGIGIMLTLAALLSGPGAHHNYQLWWLPFAAILLSLALDRSDCEACQEADLRYISAARLDARGS